MPSSIITSHLLLHHANETGIPGSVVMRLGHMLCGPMCYWTTHPSNDPWGTRITVVTFPEEPLVSTRVISKYLLFICSVCIVLLSTKMLLHATFWAAMMRWFRPADHTENRKVSRQHNNRQWKKWTQSRNSKKHKAIHWSPHVSWAWVERVTVGKSGRWAAAFYRHSPSIAHSSACFLITKAAKYIQRW